MSALFRGVFTALVTPFDQNGSVNEQVFRRLLRYQIAAQVDGVVVLGTTGEAPTLTHDEKRTLIAIAREETAGKLPLLVGTGSYATAQVIDNTVEAQKMGADGALIVTPYYNRPSQEGLYCHFKAIVEATDLPIIVYNAQGRTGQNLHTETLARIAEFPTICGVKESSSSLTQIVEVIEQIKRKKPQFAILCADDDLALPSVLLGGDGIFSVASNLIPISMCQLVHSALKGRLEDARELHYSLLPLFKALRLDTNPIPIKAAMQLCGFDVGGYRLPLCALSSQNWDKMRHVLEENAELIGSCKTKKTVEFCNSL